VNSAGSGKGPLADSVLHTMKVKLPVLLHATHWIFVADEKVLRFWNNVPIIGRYHV
jgi:hypothetical protein